MSVEANKQETTEEDAVRAMLKLAMAILECQDIRTATFGFPGQWTMEFNSTAPNHLVSCKGDQKVVITGDDVTYTLNGDDYVLGEDVFPMTEFRVWMRDLHVFIEGL